MDRQLPIEKKAYYTLLWMTQDSLPEGEVESWQIEDLRGISSKELFERLSLENAAWNEEWFYKTSQNFRSPEDLFISIYGQYDEPMPEDKVFLLFFELWRRLFPEKKTLSIFAEDLDRLIISYDSGGLDDIYPLEAHVEELFRQLKFLSDRLNDPMGVFEHTSAFLANDLEGFLYDFLQYRIDVEEYEKAEEGARFLLEYVSDPKWFLLLLSKVRYLKEKKVADHEIEELLDECSGEPDIDFVMDIAAWASENIAETLFIKSVQLALSLVHYEMEVQELLSLMVVYADALKNETLAQEITEEMFRRAENDPLQPLPQEDLVRGQIFGWLESLKESG